jgi:hypothetical protein
MSNKYIVIDGEFGGIGLDKSILTFYFMVMDDQENKVDELDLKLKSKDGIYRVEARALEINKIDLIKHDQMAITCQLHRG